MTLFGLKRRSLEDTTVPLSGQRILEWIRGGSPGAVDVTEDTVYGLTAYYAAVRLVAGTIAQLPLKVYVDGTKDQVRLRTVLDVPNPRQTPFEFWFSVLANACTWGNGLAWKVRDGSRTVREVWPLHPQRVRFEEVEPSSSNPEGKVFLVRGKDGTERPFTAESIFHLPFLSPDGLSGMSPLSAHRQALSVGLAAEKTAANFYAKGAFHEGVLTTEQMLKKDEAQRVQDDWRSKVGRGPSSAGEVPVLFGGLKFQPVSIPPIDAQVLDSRRFTVSEIARMFGIPPVLLADVEKSTSWGTGIEHQVLGWVKFGLATWLTLAEQRVTFDLLPGGVDGPWYAEYVMEGLLRGDSLTRARFYALGISSGWLNRAEPRRLENLPPGPPELEEFLTPLNMNVAGEENGGGEPANPDDGDERPMGGGDAATDSP